MISISMDFLWGFAVIAAPLAGAAIFHFEVAHMETRVAVMSIIVEDADSVEKLNSLWEGEHKIVQIICKNG